MHHFFFFLNIIFFSIFVTRCKIGVVSCHVDYVFSFVLTILFSLTFTMMSGIHYQVESKMYHGMSLNHGIFYFVLIFYNRYTTLNSNNEKGHTCKDCIASQISKKCLYGIEIFSTRFNGLNVD